MVDSGCWFTCATCTLFPFRFDASSFELDSPATRASIPSASDGFCKLENCRSSVVLEDPDRSACSSSLPYCCCTLGSWDHVPRLPSVWKLPSSVRGVVRGGSDGAVVDDDGSSIRGFFRTRRPPRLLPPRTQSRLSRLHRRHGMEPLSSLQRLVS